jgi:acetylornithine deacetylase/succinyl-diaminopimelate desuccinylase
MLIHPDRARMTGDLERLVAFNTENPPGREVEAARFLADRLAVAGFDIALSEFMTGRVNVVARLDNGPGPVFAFNSHIDTVPAGDGWTSDPFRLVERGGRLVGRGSCDAKGPIAAMVEALRLLAADRASWSGTLLGVFVADEETESRGAKSFATGRPRIDQVVIGEPTSNTTYTAHKGSLRPVVRVHGVTAHSGTPHLGENAIYKAGRLLGLIAEHHETHVCKRCHPLVGSASLTVTRISAGIADNVVPDRCDLLLDRRMVPGEDEEAVKRELYGLLDTAWAEFGVRAEIVAFQPTTGGPTETALSEPIVAACMEAATGNGYPHDAPQGFQGGCDLVHFRSLGAVGTVLGPGSLAVAHKPDEFVPVEEFVASARIYGDVALRMLRSAAG